MSLERHKNVYIYLDINGVIFKITFCLKFFNIWEDKVCIYCYTHIYIYVCIKVIYIY